jgi:hypothetical protein
VNYPKLRKTAAEAHTVKRGLDQAVHINVCTTVASARALARSGLLGCFGREPDILFHRQIVVEAGSVAKKPEVLSDTSTVDAHIRSEDLHASALDRDQPSADVQYGTFAGSVGSSQHHDLRRRD